MKLKDTRVLIRLGGGLRRPGPLQHTTRIALAVLLVLSHPLWAATIIVDETTCTLVDAITAANTDTAVGGCTAGSGADTIELTTDVVLTAVNTANCGQPCFYGETGLPAVESDISVAGGGFTIERDPFGPPFRLFLVNATLSLNDVMLTHGGGWSYPESGYGGAVANSGDLTLTNSTVSGNSDRYGGGGIINSGTTTLTSTVVSDNYTYYFGGGIHNTGTLNLTNSTISENSALRGGGIYSRDSSFVTLTDSTVSDNSVSVFFGGMGGGIYSGPGVQLTLTNSTVSDNYGGGITTRGIATLTNNRISGNSPPGGIFNSGTATVTTTMVSGNTAFQGGGISNSGTLTLTNSTVSDNHAFTTYSELRSKGGGILNAGTLTVTNSTLSGNSAIDYIGNLGGKGGGLFNSGPATLTNTTFSGNWATLSGGGVSSNFTVTSTNSILANSPSGGNCDGTITDNGNNFADDDSCGPGFADIVPGVDFDTTLADNGGPTLTHALLPSSVAIDAAGECGLDTDQRGFPRNDGACDSGSFELQGGGDDGGVPASSRVGLFVLVAILLTISWAILRPEHRTRHPT